MGFSSFKHAKTNQWLVTTLSQDGIHCKRFECMKV
jgi:hypothetical protein